MTAEPDFDVIVIGGGVAGLVTGYLLADKGINTVVIERGEAPGSKNLSGGIMYTHAIRQVFPDFVEEAPIERIITRNQLCFLNPTGHFAIDYGDQRLADATTAVTVLRAHLDQWLADRCEAAGAMVMPGVRVDSLITDHGQVCGVRAGDDELRARVVVAADGVNSFIARDAGLRGRQPTHHLAVGIKAVLKLPAAEIDERFGVSGNHGAALAIVGDASAGIGGGGFLYTNRETLSLGLLLRLDDLVAKGGESAALFERFAAHPALACYLDGTELLEYGCHLVNEGGFEMMGKLVHNGLVIVGDAAGLTLNTGLVVRGMDLAVGSAIAAAKGICQALAADDTSAAGLAGYQQALDESFVGQDMRTFARAPKFLETERLYRDYSQVLADMFFDIYALDGTPRRRMMSVGRKTLKHSPVGLRHLAKDGLKAVRAI
ncbi:MAG: FAD-dependent oxidoreductase [Bifidobacteriaceae bacterium]|jgi:electron transfer flavoprotein-quinone oxidoreductase|nr:FAD-dependent oxidoreductase [Bifidobacteriaceae bacterium]